MVAMMPRSGDVVSIGCEVSWGLVFSHTTFGGVILVEEIFGVVVSCGC